MERQRNNNVSSFKRPCHHVDHHMWSQAQPLRLTSNSSVRIRPLRHEEEEEKEEDVGLILDYTINFLLSR